MTSSKTPLLRRSSIEPLEPRTFLSVTVTGSLANSNGTPGSMTPAIDLSGVFDDPTVSTVVRVATPVGNVDIQLLDAQKPITVQNFLRYVRSGAYDSTFIHRSTSALSGTQFIQGGGYSSSTFTHIATNAPVANEFTTNFVVPNSRGTIAMAKTGSADAATSDFLINVSNNSSLDDPANLGGFTVFGNVINDTLTTVDAIAAVPRFVAAAPFGEIPLRNYTVDNLNAGTVPTGNNLITTTIETLSKLTFTAASSDPSIVTPVVNGNKLSLAYGQSAGAATVTIMATDSNGQSLVATFNAENALSVRLGVGGAKGLTLTDADGTVATVSLKGAGSAAVTFSGTGLTSTPGKGGLVIGGSNVGLAGIAATGTSSTSALTINAKGGNGSIALGSITADNAMKSISAKTTALAGTLSTGGAVGKLDLGSASDSQISIGGSGADKPIAITIGSLVDTGLISGVPIKSLKVSNIGDADGVQSVLGASSIGTITVAGNLSGESITLSQPFGGKAQGLKSLKVGGGIANTSIRSVASLGSITASSLSASTIFAGVASTALPAAAGDFANGASISSVKIAGTLANSNIAASQLGKLTVGALQTSNGGTAFGFAADTIAALATSAGGTKVSLKKLGAQSDVVAQLKGIDLVDGRVTVI